MISKGPIDFGRYPYKYSHQDFYTIWTDYKLIVTPARIKLESCPNGCLALKKIKPICPMSTSYQVGFSTLDKPSNVSDKSWLPWKVDVTSGFLNVEDPQSSYPIDLKYNFDRRIRGEVYDATK